MLQIADAARFSLSGGRFDEGWLNRFFFRLPGKVQFYNWKKNGQLMPGVGFALAYAFLGLRKKERLCNQLLQFCDIQNLTKIGLHCLCLSVFHTHFSQKRLYHYKFDGKVCV